MENNPEEPERTMSEELRDVGGSILMVVGIGAFVAGAATGIHIHDDHLFIKDAVKTGAEMFNGAFVTYIGYSLFKGNLFTGRGQESSND
jgi:hypothetical protein